MADVLTYPGMGTNGGVPAPYLQGRILPAGQGFGGRIALGMSPTTRRFADLYSNPTGMQLTDAQVRDMIVAGAQGNQGGTTINFNYDVANNIQQFTLPGQLVPQRPISLPGVTGNRGLGGSDGTDAFADIDIPIPYTGTATKWEECFTNNSPGAGSVAWATFKVKYKSVENTITAGNTANGWLYWSAAAPTVISSSATKPSLAAGQFLVGYNNAGTFEPSLFSKLITAGFISVNALSALSADLGTVTAGIIQTAGSGARIVIDGTSATKQIAAFNASAQTFQVKSDGSGFWGAASGGVYPITVAADGSITINAAKLTLTNVGTSALNNNATKILSKSYQASGGPLTGAQDTYTSHTHTSEGNPVKVQGSCVIVNNSVTLAGTVTVMLYYDSVLIASTVTRSLSPGETEAVTLNGYVASPDVGGSLVTLDAVRSAGTSANLNLLTIYLESMEDKGK